MISPFFMGDDAFWGFPNVAMYEKGVK